MVLKKGVHLSLRLNGKAKEVGKHGRRRFRKNACWLVSAGKMHIVD